jgi:hypothetical protein
MVYDRYALFLSKAGGAQPSEPSLIPAAGASEGPVPNTSWKEAPENELVLNPDAIDYWEERYSKRKEVRDDARAE